jgi:3-oxoacyl-[acyl-carrier protein] reductase
MNMDFGLRGKVALITGAGRGIGLAEATALAAEGVNIAVNDLDASMAETSAATLRSMGVKAEAFAGDAADESIANRIVAAAAASFGRLDILVNNAGLAVRPLHRVEDMPADAWDRMIHVHMRSTFLWSRAVIPTMRKNGFGRIVNTSSMNFTGGGRPGVSHYAAAKAGIAGFTATMAREVARSGITANAIAPGYVETELISNFTPEMRELVRRQNPVGRTCRPDEVAALVTFLCSTQAGFINGEIVCMDGGRRDFFWGDY